jgi:hypothetical protein
MDNANDKTDARFLAKQVAMGVLPQGYIYPKEQRSVSRRQGEETGRVEFRRRREDNIGVGSNHQT